jgi:hypothetical protein
MCAGRRTGAIMLAQVGFTHLLLTATGSPARASNEPEQIRIQFSAPKKCTDAASFTRALRQRTGRFQLGGAAEPVRVFVVTITQSISLISGRLEIQGPGTEVSLRDVSGSTCEEVTAALALMAALAIDPGAVSPRAVSPRAAPATALSPASLPSRSPAKTAVAPLPPLAPSPVAEQSAPALSNTPASAPWKWSAGAHGGVSLRMSPTMGLGGLLFVEAAAPGMAVLGPVLRAGLFLNRSEVTAASGAAAEFQWAAAMVEGCPIRLVSGKARLSLHPCLALHLGVLRGQGRNLDRPEKVMDPWIDLGPVARIRVAVSTRLFVEAQGMVVFPLRRLTFDMHDAGPGQAATTVFTVPRLGVLAGIGVAFEFQ